MRENRPSGLEGGVAFRAIPTPIVPSAREALEASEAAACRNVNKFNKSWLLLLG